MNRRPVLAALASLAVAPLSLPVLAQSYPSKPVRVVVPFAPGGTTDIIARIMSERMGAALGQTVVVENKAGGGGIVGAAELVKAPADGHVLGMATVSTTASNPAINPRTPYNPLSDFTPITLGARGPLVIVVHNSLNVKTLPELIAHAKANPGKVSYASFGTGTSAHIFGETFKANAGVQMEHIPYKGGADLAADLIEGRVQVAFDAAPAAINNAKSGKVRIIAVAAPTRSPFLPDVPTTVEQGVKDIDIVSFLGWFGPKGMSPEVVKKLQAALAQSIAQPAVKEFYNTGAYTAESSTPELLAREVKDSHERWGALVRKIGLQKQ